MQLPGERQSLETAVAAVSQQEREQHSHSVRRVVARRSPARTLAVERVAVHTLAALASEREPEQPRMDWLRVLAPVVAVSELAPQPVHQSCQRDSPLLLVQQEPEPQEQAQLALEPRQNYQKGWPWCRLVDELGMVDTCARSLPSCFAASLVACYLGCSVHQSFGWSVGAAHDPTMPSLFSAVFSGLFVPHSLDANQIFSSLLAGLVHRANTNEALDRIR